MEIKDALKALESSKNVRFESILNICKSFFGEPRIRGSHHIFKMPWPGDPRINIQKDGSKAKVYQVKQVKRALEKLLNEKG